MNITELLSTYRISYKTDGNSHCRPGWIQIDCPFCGKDTNKWHLGINIKGVYGNCWRCGSHSLVSIIAEITGFSFAQLYKLTKDVLPEKYFEKPESAGILKVPKGAGELLDPHKKYLTKRGFDYKELQKQWGIGGIGISSELSWHIYIPIHFHGKVVSWIARSISDDGIRYKKPLPSDESIRSGELLYGQDYTTHSAIVVEGPTDVWGIGPGAVATLGMNFTTAQVRKIAKFKRRAICFDNETAAQKAAQKLCESLSAFPGDTYQIILESKDAGSASEKEIQKLRKFLE